MLDLDMAKPSNDITTDRLFQQIVQRLEPALAKAGKYKLYIPTYVLYLMIYLLGKERIGKPLFTPSQPLTTQQWDTVQQFQRNIEAEYEMRRQMLLTRLDVTIQSFQWSDKARLKQDQIESEYSSNRKFAESLLHGGASTSIVALLAAREDLAIIEKTSSASMRTRSSIEKHVMGQVPDRGGRANEHVAPAREMPSWTKRVPNQQGGRVSES